MNHECKVDGLALWALATRVSCVRKFRLRRAMERWKLFAFDETEKLKAAVLDHAQDLQIMKNQRHVAIVVLAGLSVFGGGAILALKRTLHRLEDISDRKEDGYNEALKKTELCLEHRIDDKDKQHKYALKKTEQRLEDNLHEKYKRQEEALKKTEHRLEDSVMDKNKQQQQALKKVEHRLEDRIDETDKHHNEAIKKIEHRLEGSISDRDEQQKEVLKKTEHRLGDRIDEKDREVEEALKKLQSLHRESAANFSSLSGKSLEVSPSWFRGSRIKLPDLRRLSKL